MKKREHISRARISKGRMSLKMRVLTFNIRYSRGIDGINTWPHRRSLVYDLIHTLQPDIIGFQEPLQDQMDDLIEMLTGYRYVGVAREDGKKEGEYNPIFYRESYQTESSDTFWLSDTPDTPNRTWEGQTRICTWVRFSKPAQFALMNTHLEYCSLATQMKSASLIISKTGELFDKAPVILTGDFNLCPGTPPHELLGSIFVDTYYRVNGQSGCGRVTFHGFTGKVTLSQFPPGTSPCRIDYIWLKGAIDPLTCSIITDNPGAGVYPSDHWPVVADIEVLC